VSTAFRNFSISVKKTAIKKTLWLGSWFIFAHSDSFLLNKQKMKDLQKKCDRQMLITFFFIKSILTCFLSKWLCQY